MIAKGGLRFNSRNNRTHDRALYPVTFPATVGEWMTRGAVHLFVSSLTNDNSRATLQIPRARVACRVSHIQLSTKYFYKILYGILHFLWFRSIIRKRSYNAILCCLNYLKKDSERYSSIRMYVLSETCFI